MADYFYAFFQEINYIVQYLIVNLTQINMPSWSPTDRVLVALVSFALGLFIIYKSFKFIFGVFKL